MKSNIDLTENRIFSRNSQNPLDLTITDFFNTKVPWKIQSTQIHSDDELDLEHQRKSIIAVGNREQRAEVRHYREMDSLDYCDCCGTRMNLIPWDREIGVCRKCDEYYKKTDLGFDRCKWRKKDNIRNAVIRIA